MNFLTKIQKRSPKYIQWFSRTIFQQPHPALHANNIVMFHGSRSGSTVLGDLLNQHSTIFWDKEVFSSRRRYMIYLKYLISNPFAWLRFRINLVNKPLYGFETQFVHLISLEMNLHDYITQLKTVGFSQFIVLERKNYLRIITSVLIAFEKAKWNQSKHSHSKLTQIKININHVFPEYNKSLMWALEYFEDCFKTIKTILTQQSVLYLTYEDDIAINPLIGYKRVCQFLHLPYQSASINFSKANPFSLKQIITNFDEVEQLLKGTHFEWMLYQ